MKTIIDIGFDRFIEINTVWKSSFTKFFEVVIDNTYGCDFPQFLFRISLFKLFTFEFCWFVNRHWSKEKNKICSSYTEQKYFDKFNQPIQISDVLTLQDTASIVQKIKYLENQISSSLNHNHPVIIAYKSDLLGATKDLQKLLGSRNS